MRTKTDTVENLIIVLAGVAALAAMTSCTSSQLAAEADADRCARRLAAQTDMNIVWCYEQRGLPIPDDLT